jgi:hypothetical protein
MQTAQRTPRLLPGTCSGTDNKQCTHRSNHMYLIQRNRLTTATSPLQSVRASVSLIQHLINRSTCCQYTRVNKQSEQHILRKSLPNYFKFTTQFFPHFSELKIGARLKLRHYFSLWKSLKKHFPLRTSGLAERVVNVTDCEKYLHANFFSLHIHF